MAGSVSKKTDRNIDKEVPDWLLMNWTLVKKSPLLDGGRALYQPYTLTLQYRRMIDIKEYFSTEVKHFKTLKDSYHYLEDIETESIIKT